MGKRVRSTSLYCTSPDGAMTYLNFAHIAEVSERLYM